MYQKLILIGNLAGDPEISYTQSSKVVAKFAVITNKKFYVDGQLKETSERHNCKAFGRNAEIIGEYLKKGALVHVEGELSTIKFKDRQTNADRYFTEMILDSDSKGLIMLGKKPNQAAQSQHGGHASHKQQPESHVPNGFNDRGGFSRQ